MSPSRHRVLRPAPLALSALALGALLAASISPLVPHAAALDPTPGPSASTTPAPTPPAPTPDPPSSPTPDPGPTPTLDPGPTVPPDPAPTATPDPGPTVSPASFEPVPPATTGPSATPDPMDEFPLYPLVDPLPPIIVPMSLLDPSLPSPHTMDSLVSDGCGSCHRSHAASDELLLVAVYRTDLKPAGDAYAQGEFALCYACHDPAPFADDAAIGTNFGLHDEHLTRIVSVGNAVCAECHYRLHATSAEAGSKLVNFAPNVQPSQLGTLEWTGTGGRSCTLTCHGFEHVGEGY